MNKISLLLVGAAILLSCKKDSTIKNNTGNGGDDNSNSGTIVKGTDPAVSATQGFFLDGFEAKNFAKPATQDVTKPSATGAVSVTVDLSQIISKVSKYMFGNNTNPYMGQYVTDAVLIQPLVLVAVTG